MKPKVWLLKSGRVFLGVFLFLMFSPLVGDVSAEREASFTFNNGYRVDDLDWSIAGNNINILSELTWNDLKIYQVKADGKVVLEWFYLRGSIGYGWILGGENQDSDYDGNNRTLESSRSNNNSDNGTVMDVSVGVGYQFNPGSGWLKVAPLVGYSLHEQNLTITDGFKTIPATGSFSGLNSTYDAKWKGPWAGVDLSIEASRNLTLFGSFEYHLANYEAKANWNLRGDFAHPKSFEHDANGKGIVVSAGGIYAINDHWLINANVGFQNWSTYAGTDLTFNANGTTSVTRLNEVNWSSLEAMLGIMYRF